ncbi:MAG: polyamine ABC transporter substrate-binding protein [Proteobacteria bacterium]|nr:polyamine ABC transporter substrate-binding protein [Pseudomonadota bacterium]
MKKLLIVLASLIIPFSASAKEELFIYNWSDYVAEGVIENFEEEFGIDVTYDVFDSNEVLEAKLLAGNSGYDIVVPSGAFLANQIRAGVFQALDKSQLPNLANLDPAILEYTGKHDPDNSYSVNWLYGTTGIGYNIDMIEERMPGATEDGTVDSLDILFDPELVSKFADCGVTMLDAPTEVVEVALHYLGHDPNTENTNANQEALDMLKKVRPYIKYFDSSQYIDDLANGEICLALGWSGDVFLASDEAADGINVWYSVPSQGTVIWFDQMAIPAHKFINYYMRPEVVAANTNYVWYPNANLVANTTPGLIDQEILDDPAVYADEETMAKLFPDQADSPQKSRISSRVFNEFKTSN